MRRANPVSLSSNLRIATCSPLGPLASFACAPRYTLKVSDAEKADKLGQSLPPILKQKQVGLPPCRLLLPPPSSRTHALTHLHRLRCIGCLAPCTTTPNLQI
mmetsp:Transcript_4973/g.10824  ORF Transcript_4973/g.10824 Transcript_4973/m.10824 type:complete len:102 (+) Transcript_4973:228-533(+)